MGLLNPVFFLLVLVLVFSSAIADGVGDYLFETKYIDVPLSHFDFTKNTTFKLRYLVNDTYWSRHKGPILFYTGNEGDIETFAQNTGFIWEIAPEFKALIVFAEHRYYGKSMPYGAKSYSDPGHSGYLSCTEAMADFVDLIYKIWDDEKAKHPVIAIGGSYGGMLSAWIRMKYPSTFIGALASSAPIWQFEGMTPCNTFYRIMTSAYTMANPECSETVRKFWPLLEKYGSTDDGRRLLSQSWKLCGSLNSTEDVKTLKEYVSEALAAVAMVNYPYETSFLAPLPPYPVKAMCQFMNDSKLPELELLGNVFEGISVYFNYTGSAKCLNTDLDADGGVSYSGWNYQACTEMVMPVCSDGVTDMLPAEKWDFEEVSNDCYTKRGVKPQLRQIEKLFGGKDIHEHSNIIFSNGLLDPWSGGGVLQDISPSIQTVIIPEAAHHLDLRASNPADPDSVKRARKLYKHIFKRWLADFHARFDHH